MSVGSGISMNEVNAASSGGQHAVDRTIVDQEGAAHHSRVEQKLVTIFGTYPNFSHCR
jgi:hypothetical protein